MASNRSEPAYANRVRDAYDGNLYGLFEAGEAVQSLLTHPGWEHVVAIVRAEVADLDRKLDGRPLDSIQGYAFDHGRRGGLLAFADVAHAIVSHALAKETEQNLKHGAAGSVPIGAS